MCSVALALLSPTVQSTKMIVSLSKANIAASNAIVFSLGILPLQEWKSTINYQPFLAVQLTVGLFTSDASCEKEIQQASAANHHRK